MATNFYCRKILIGGAAGALDAIDGTALADLDFAVVSILNKIYMYTLDDDSAAAEDSPSVISPDTNAGTKRWILQGIGINSGVVGSPSVAFGDGDSGFYEIADDRIVFATLGVRRINLETGFWEAQDTNGWRLENDDSTSTLPVFVFGSDTDTGIGRAGADALSLIAGGVEGVRLTELNGGIVPQYDTTATITAYATGGQANAVQLNSAVNEISVCATSGDSVKLPSALIGSKITIINNGAAPCDVFPATDDNLGAGVDTAISLANGSSVIYQAFDVTNWETVSAIGAGKVLQVVNVQDGAVNSGATTIPDDDTIPQITEGDEYMTLAITPSNTNNKLKIEVTANVSISAGDFFGTCLFQDATANALAGIYTYLAVNECMAVTFTHYMTAGTVASTTFRVRIGGASGTITFNGKSTARKYGGVLASSITITEISA